MWQVIFTIPWKIKSLIWTRHEIYPLLDNVDFWSKSMTLTLEVRSGCCTWHGFDKHLCLGTSESNELENTSNCDIDLGGRGMLWWIFVQFSFKFPSWMKRLWTSHKFIQAIRQCWPLSPIATLTFDVGVWIFHHTSYDYAENVCKVISTFLYWMKKL